MSSNAVGLLIVAVGVSLVVAVAVIARRRPLHPGDAAFEAHLAELATGPGWLPPPGWDEEQERLNAEYALSGGGGLNACASCGFTRTEHGPVWRCPGGDPGDTFTEPRNDGGPG